MLWSCSLVCYSLFFCTHTESLQLRLFFSSSVIESAGQREPQQTRLKDKWICLRSCVGFTRSRRSKCLSGDAVYHIHSPITTSVFEGPANLINIVYYYLINGFTAGAQVVCNHRLLTGEGPQWPTDKCGHRASVAGRNRIFNLALVFSAGMQSEVCCWASAAALVVVFLVLFHVELIMTAFHLGFPVPLYWYCAGRVTDMILRGTLMKKRHHWC